MRTGTTYATRCPCPGCSGRASQRRECRRPRKRGGQAALCALGCACLFLLGYLPGIWLGQSRSLGVGSQLAAYYLSKSSYSTVFSVWQWQFSADFLQLAALYLCSFSALGCFFLPILFFLRGGFLGLCAACVLAAGESRGLVCYWLLSSLSNLSVLFAGLWLSGYSAAISNGLFQCVFSGGAAPWAVGGGFSAADNTLSVLPAADRNGQSGQRLAVSLPRRSPAVRACFPRYNLDPQEERLSPAARRRSWLMWV